MTYVHEALSLRRHVVRTKYNAWFFSEVSFEENLVWILWIITHSVVRKPVELRDIQRRAPYDEIKSDRRDQEAPANSANLSRPGSFLRLVGDGGRRCEQAARAIKLRHHIPGDKSPNIYIQHTSVPTSVYLYKLKLISTITRYEQTGRGTNGSQQPIIYELNEYNIQFWFIDEIFLTDEDSSSFASSPHSPFDQTSRWILIIGISARKLP